ncbi:glycosyl transferase group 1 [Methanosalsum zhilinae DSM 4017]|uniref:Glycosyl transferase group 1 n=1 Tax=Methanosalsum zhilinae (strain DSM 4017 / NBRC 107636 / OCM 62 / WeN5) TaxID=679901 RepID=F7XPW6_METZD|nr:glycosyltransferase [Methanosalsum zhilinae]AEH61487.1 glycosyl transferase group 1 [Methanosalsum zhilinae DSM 4017]
MNILVIPTTDWIRHPVPNRLNFIFDILAENHNVHVAHFTLKKFHQEKERNTRCILHNLTTVDVDDPSSYYLINSLTHLVKLRNIIKMEKIDVIVSANILPAFAVNFIKGDLPLVFDYLDHYEESAATYYPNSFFGKIVKTGVKSIIHYNLKKSNSVITVTEEFKQFLHSIGVKDVHVIPNGVDTTMFKQISTEVAKKDLGLDGIVIGYVGSLEYWVDLETVIKALPELDVKLLVVGPGLFTDYGEMIKELADKLGVLDKITFTGRVEYHDLYKYISAMDLGLNPLKHVKKNEITVGGKIFNYLACGKPVLSSRMIALETLMDDDLYYYDDLKSFINMTNKILSQIHDGSKYMQIARDFDWKNIANEYEDVIQKVLHESNQT